MAMTSFRSVRETNITVFLRSEFQVDNGTVLDQFVKGFIERFARFEITPSWGTVRRAFVPNPRQLIITFVTDTPTESLSIQRPTPLQLSLSRDFFSCRPLAPVNVTFTFTEFVRALDGQAVKNLEGASVIMSSM
ncbi:MAG: hypothetical protein Q8J97_05510, partial [Flavobacteriaceae bacterium]|nr:hypothetical protein [Flavobacteriaceae bacterium]